MEPPRRQRVRPPRGPRHRRHASCSGCWSKTLQRLPDDLKVGDRVVACVKADYFVKQGDFSLHGVRHAPPGPRRPAREARAPRAPSCAPRGCSILPRKKPHPVPPPRHRPVTGERSDAEKDIHRNAELRWPHVAARTVHAAVQGERCVPETIAALKTLDADARRRRHRHRAGRRGPQHLLGFSDERLLRAVAAASTPDRERDRARERPSDPRRRRRPPGIHADRRRQAHRPGRRRAARDRPPAPLSPAGNATHARPWHDIAQLEQLRSRPSLRSPEAMLQGREQHLFLLVSRGRERAAPHRVRTAAHRRAARVAARVVPGCDARPRLRHRATCPVASSSATPRTGAGGSTQVVVTVGEGSFAARSEGERKGADAATPWPSRDEAEN